MQRSNTVTKAIVLGHRLRILIPVVVLAIAAAAGPVRAARTVAVGIHFDQFTPATMTVQVGDTITWTNQDVAIHNAVALDGSFGTDQLATGVSGSITFSAVGTFPYRCTIHPSMLGSVIVTAAAATPPATDAAVTRPDRQGTPIGLVLVGVAILSLIVTFRGLRGRAWTGPADQEI